jgi:tripartite-type tricarboxylate transporter receptor subunit TctC
MHSLARTLALLVLILALPAGAQEFPSRPIALKIPHDGFKKALDDPEYQKALDQLDQELWYRSSEDYAKYARETFQKERALIERLGLLAK